MQTAPSVAIGSVMSAGARRRLARRAVGRRVELVAAAAAERVVDDVDDHAGPRRRSDARREHRGHVEQPQPDVVTLVRLLHGAAVGEQVRQRLVDRAW